MPDEPINLFAQQEANRRKSRWLVVGFIAFFAWLGFGGDWIAYQMTLTAPANHYHHLFPWFGLVLSGVAGGIATYAWKTGPDKVIWASGAWELLEPVGPEQTQLVNVVEEMSVASGLPRPRIFLVDDPDPNAFATGRDPQTARIAVTTGLLGALSRDELQAVIAHEMGHVKNLDVQLMTFLAALVGAVALISDGLGRILRGGFRIGGGRGGGGRSKGGPGAVVLVVLVVWLISWLLAPLICRVMAMGVSRKREYLADAMGAQFTRNPMALASALEKIERADAPTKSIKQGCAHLCIADPMGRSLSNKEGFFADLFGTHPPMALRVARLKAMGYQEMKKSGTFVAPAGA
jgi:heat shock protein HtpX